MRNDELLNQLVTGLQPTRPRSSANEAALLAAIGLAELFLYLFAGTIRPDFAEAVHLPVLWWKLGSLGVLDALSVAGAFASLAPERSPRWWLGATAMAFVLILAFGGFLDLSGSYSVPVLERLDWRHGVSCVLKITALSLPIAAAYGLIARRGASTHPSATALAGAIGAAAWGAFVFAFSCPSDDPLYIVTWYIVGCGATIVLTRTFLHRLIRW